MKYYFLLTLLVFCCAGCSSENSTKERQQDTDVENKDVEDTDSLIIDDEIEDFTDIDNIEAADDSEENPDSEHFTLTSSVFADGGTLPALYTCDGANGGVNPPLSWENAPEGTSGFALMMTTLANDGEKWNWVLYNIPAGITEIGENSSDVGTAGPNSDGGALAYAPPCSQGPGAKTYTFTIYALSENPKFDVPANEVSGQVLRNAISGITLETSEINVSYTRPEVP